MRFALFFIPLLLPAQVTVNITWPTPGQTVASHISISGTASSTAGSIVSTQGKIDSGSFVNVDNSDTTPWQWTIDTRAGQQPYYPTYTTPLSLGSHTFTIQVTDSASNVGTASVTVNVIHTNPTCSHTLLSSGIYCEQAAVHFSSDQHTPDAVTFANGYGDGKTYHAGDTIVVECTGNDKTSPFYRNSISNTGGYYWNAIVYNSSGFQGDDNLVQNAIYYAVVPASTTASDTITILKPYASFTSMYVTVFSGLGGLDTGIGEIQGPLAATSGTTGNMTTTAGDLCWALAGGAPMYIPSLWTELLEDTARPYAMIAAYPATTNNCNLTYPNSPEDASGTDGLTFKPEFNSNYHGQSLQLGANFVTNSSVPQTITHRTEFYIHNVDVAAGTGYIHLMQAGTPTATGDVIYLQVLSHNSVTLNVNNQWLTIPATSLCNGGNQSTYDIGSLPLQSVYGRIELDETNKLFDVELWDIGGNRVYSSSCPYTSATPTGTGMQLGTGSEENLYVGFFKVFSTLLPMNSHMPETAENANAVLHWKFDGTLLDSSGNNYTATANSTAVYTNTPYQNVVAQVRTSDWNSWAYTLAQRAPTFTVDGSQSATQSDTSTNLTCQWYEVNPGVDPLTLAARPALTIASPNSCISKVTNAIAGEYNLNLTVTDAQGVTNFTNGVTNYQAKIGVVATDSNNIVVPKNSLSSRLFGDLVAYGKNPWGYQDKFSHDALLQRGGHIGIDPENPAPYDGDYQTLGWVYGSGGYYNKPLWEVALDGTVSYSFNGGGWNLGNTAIKTSLTSAITTTTQTSIAIANASVLDFSDMPTRIIIYSASAASGGGTATNEEIRICNTSSSSGAATLTVCYDGRGQIPLTWPATADTVVTQDKVVGSGTHFISSDRAPLCPLAKDPVTSSILPPGIPGRQSYMIGTIALTPGSATVTGSGVNWGTCPGGSCTLFPPSAYPYLMVQSTHAGGTPFTFIAKISALAGTSMTLERAYPADADSKSAINYYIMPGTTTIDVRYPNQYIASTDSAGDKTTLDQVMFATTGCESNVSAYMNAKLSPAACGNLGVSDAPLGCNSYGFYHDVPALDGQSYSGYAWSSVENKYNFSNSGSYGGIQFYGEGLASRAMYLRSGLTAPATAGNILDDWWSSAPFVNPVVSGLNPLFMFGPGIGAFLAKVSDNRPIPWPTLRNYAAFGEEYANGYGNTSAPDHCIFFSGATRDIGGALSLLILAAEYDPSTTSGDCGNAGGCRGRWISDLAAMYAGDLSCKQSDNSWSNGNLWNTEYGPVTLTNNSVSGSASSVPSGLCVGTATGTGTISANAATFTVASGTVPTPQTTIGSPMTVIVLTGTKGGTQYSTVAQYTGSGGSGQTITLSILWPGDSGTITWMGLTVPSLPPGGTSTGAMIAFATGTTDFTDMVNSYSCLQTSGSTFTLSQPWLGTTGSSYYGFNVYNVNGFGQQPFMLGIKTYAMGQLASWNLDSSLNPYPADYLTLNTSATQWLHDFGIDVPTLSTNYGVNFGYCQPNLITANGVFDTRTPGCSTGFTAGGLYLGREQNQELGNAIADFYQYNTSPTNKTFGDNTYGAVWGHSLLNTGGVYYDAYTTAMNAPLTNISMASVALGKWYGFFNGIGMSHRWPAVRVGGLRPQNLVNRTVSCSLSAVSGATQVKVTVTEPTGIVSSPVACSACPCVYQIDARQGEAIVKMDYWSSGALLIPGVPTPVR